MAKPQDSCNSLCAKIFLSVRHIILHSDDMVDTRLQGCDVLLIGLSWIAATQTVGDHNKLFCYVSAKVTTVYISVVVSNFESWIQSPLTLTHHIVLSEGQVESTCHCLFN
jgi:hypothetical protein